MLETPRAQMTAIYVGYFGRAPDPAGLDFWLDQLEQGLAAADGGRTLADIASSFALSEEAQALFPFLQRANEANDAEIRDFVASVFENLFDRAPDAAGLDFWTEEIRARIDDGEFVGTAIMDIISGARDGVAANEEDSQDDEINDATTLANKVSSGDSFLRQVVDRQDVFDPSLAREAVERAGEDIAPDEIERLAIDLLEGRLVIARDDVASPSEDRTASGDGLIIDVLANDNLPAEGAVEVAIEIGPRQGTATVLDDGRIAYRPDPGFNVVQKLAYSVTSETGQSDVGLLTIRPDRSPPELTVNDTVVGFDGDETQPLRFLASLDRPAAAPVTFTYELRLRSPEAEGPRVLQEGRAEIPAGDTFTRLNLADVDLDPRLLQEDAAFVLEVTGVQGGAVADGSAIGFIARTDAPAEEPEDPPALSIGDAEVVEGEEGQGSLRFEVSLDRPAEEEVFFDFVVRGESATAGEDFEPRGGSEEFLPGQQSIALLVEVFGDTEVEDDETLVLDILGADNATIAEGTAIGTIVDDDTNDDETEGAPTDDTNDDTNDDDSRSDLPALSVRDGEVVEVADDAVQMVFEVVLDRAPEDTVLFSFLAHTQGASQADVVPLRDDTEDLPAGMQEGEIFVTVPLAEVPDGADTVRFDITTVEGATVADGEGLAAIFPNDTAAAELFG